MRQSKTIVTVTVRDSKGGVDVDDGGMQYEGVIRNFSATVNPEQEIHMRLEPADLFVPYGTIDMTGVMVDELGVECPVDLWVGVEFHLEVKKINTVENQSMPFNTKDDQNPKLRAISGVEGFEYLMTDSETDATMLTPPPVMHGFDRDDSIEDEAMAEPTGVIGTLRQVSLAEVLQGLELTRKTARIEVRASEQDPQGVVYLRGGQIVWAEIGGVFGEPAFYRMAAMRQGMYRVRFGRSSSETNIEKPLAFLILEAMRRMDETSAEAPEPEKAIYVATREASDDLTVRDPQTKLGPQSGRSKPVNCERPPIPPEMDLGNAAVKKKRKKKKVKPPPVRKTRSRRKTKGKPAGKREAEALTDAANPSVFSSFFHEAGEQPHEKGEDSIDEIDPTFSSISRAVADIGNSQEELLNPGKED